MNSKQAKQRRRVAEQAMENYVATTILTDDMLKEAEDKGISLQSTLPAKAYYQVQRQLRNGIGSQRWFYRLYKKYPDFNEDDYKKYTTN